MKWDSGVVLLLAVLAGLGLVTLGVLAFIAWRAAHVY